MFGIDKKYHRSIISKSPIGGAKGGINDEKELVGIIGAIDLRKYC